MASSDIDLTIALQEGAMEVLQDAARTIESFLWWAGGHPQDTILYRLDGAGGKEPISYVNEGTYNVPRLINDYLKSRLEVREK